MSESDAPEFGAFDTLKQYAVVFQVLGWLILAAGLVTVFVGFSVNGVYYSGLGSALVFIFPGLAVLGLGRLMSAVAVIGDACRETLLRAERLIAIANAKTSLEK